jgi:hypothetical protein
LTIARTSPPDGRSVRRRNWWALAAGALVGVPAYLFYGSAFLVDGQGAAVVDRQPLLLALALAPFAFIVVAVVSRDPDMSKHVLRAMGLLIALGLGLGLLTPLLGASAGLGAGTALCLARPDVPNVVRNRFLAVGLGVVYTLVLLVTITPAGVFTGGILPTLLIGLADDFTLWQHLRRSG